MSAWPFNNALWWSQLGGGGGGPETDPIFTASPAAGILAGDVTNWDTAYGWGDHAAAGYLTSYTETDPVFVASPAGGILAGDITNWDTAYGWGNHATAGYLTSYTETDPIFGASAAAGIAALDITNWDTAYGWGDHATAGYLTSFTEADPVALGQKGNANGIATLDSGGKVPQLQLPAVAITNTFVCADQTCMLGLSAQTGDVCIRTDENTSYILQGTDPSVLGDWQELLSTVTETDPLFTASAASGILAGDITNWDAAYGWGDHSLAGYLTSYTETDPVFGASPAAGILAGDITNWDTAYGWGDHGTEGYLKNTLEDTTPQLGGNLDVNNFDIRNANAGNGMTLRTVNRAGGGTGGVSIITGNATTSGNGGSFFFTGGSGVTAGGSFNVTAGDGDLIGGVVKLQPGKDSTDESNNGTIEFQSPNGATKAVETRWFGAGASSGNFVSFKAPDGVAGTQFYTLPAALPSVSGQALVSTTGGVMSWQTVLTSFTETDPVFGASPAAGILAGDITNWDTAYGWGDHSTEGYLKNVVEDTTPQLGGTLDTNGQLLRDSVDGYVDTDHTYRVIKNAFAEMQCVAYSDTATNGGSFGGYHYGGTSGTPALLPANAMLIDLRGYAYNGTAAFKTASLAAEIVGTPSASSLPTRWVFSTVPSGSTTIAPRFQVEPDGTLSVLTTDYEDLVLADDDIPNKKWVDDQLVGYVTNPMSADLDVNDYAIEGKDNATGAGGNLTFNGGDSLDDSGPGGVIFVRGGAGDGSAPTLPAPPANAVPADIWLVDVQSTPGYVGFAAPTNVSAGSTGDGANTVWTLPEGDGTSGQAMVTDGGGVLSWASFAAAPTVAYLENVVEDTTPELGANLSCGAYSLRYGDGALFNIQPANHPTPVAGSPGSVAIRSQHTSTSSGAPVQVVAGNTSANGVSGGNASLDAGDGTGTNGSGGFALVRGGDGTLNGGDVRLIPGLDTTDQSANGAVEVYGWPGQTVATEMRFYEAYANGQNYVAIKAADTLAGDTPYTLPAAYPSVNGQALTSTTGGAMSWATVLTDVVQDLSPQLGANLYVNGFSVQGEPNQGHQAKLIGSSSSGAAVPALAFVRGGDIIAGSSQTTAGDGRVLGGSNGNTAGNQFGGGATVEGGAAIASSDGTGGNATVRGGLGGKTGGSVILEPSYDNTDKSDNGNVIVKPITTGHEVELRMYDGPNLGSSGWLGLKVPTVTNDKAFQLSLKVVAVDHTAAHSVGEDEDILEVDASGGNVTINLHSAANERIRELNIKRIDASATNTVTVNRAGADLIDGQTSVVLGGSTQWTNLKLAPNGGTAWYVL